MLPRKSELDIGRVMPHRFLLQTTKIGLKYWFHPEKGVMRDYIGLSLLPSTGEAFSKQEIIGRSRDNHTGVMLARDAKKRTDVIYSLMTRSSATPRDAVIEAKRVLSHYLSKAKKRGIRRVSTDWTIINPRHAVQFGFKLVGKKTTPNGVKLYRYLLKL